MARDWRKVALAVWTASALASVCPQIPPVEAQQVAQASKAREKASRRPTKAADDDGSASAERKRQDPAESQRAVDNAASLLKAGKVEQAEAVLSATLAGGSLPPAIMARALYFRGMAYRERKKPAQAISDLTSALWVKGGLTADDRADALKLRAAAYTDAGLTETGAVAAAGSATSKQASATHEGAPKSWGTVTTPTAGGGGATAQTAQSGPNWFKNWFSAWSTPGTPTGSNAATASMEKPEGPAVWKQQGDRPSRAASSWSSNTEVKAAAASAEDRQSGSRSLGRGKYKVQLAAVRTQKEARALADKAERALGGLASEPEIDQAVFGNMGSFYRVRVGPFATIREAQAVCARVKGSGFDCLTVTQ